jgi:hypothetical protein
MFHVEMWGSRTALAGALTAICVLPVAGAQAKAPTGAQVRKAVRAAERSRNLWATVNICNTAAYRHTLGVRGQMPALGFNADLRMTFEVDYFSSARHAYLPLKGVANKVDLGSATKGYYQAGVRFDFKPHSGQLRGRVVFSWRYHGRAVGSITKVTSPGHSNAQYGNPRGYSRATCSIP